MTRIFESIHEELVEKVRGRFIYTRGQPGEYLAQHEATLPQPQELVGKRIRISVVIEVLS